MDELVGQIGAMARGMWRRRWIGVIAAWAVGALGAVFVMGYPDRYEAVARLYVDTKTVLRPLMRDLAIDPDTDLSAAMLSKTLITRPNIEQLVRTLKLDVEAKDQASRDNKVLTVLTSVKIASLGRDNIYDFTYRDVDPERARTVVQGLVAMFLDVDSQARQRDSKQARDFIDEQVKEYESRLAEAEGRLKEFKLRNLGISVASGRDYFSRISTLEEDMAKVTVELRAAEQSRDALRRELGGETATLLPETPSSESTAVSVEFDARLDAQRKQLDELLRRYTDLHPDVIATRRLIVRLEEQKAAEVEAKRRAMQGKPARSPMQADPVAQRVKLALAEGEANVASLRFRAGDTQVRLNQLRASASRIPQVEAEMAQLTRDYDVVKRNYEAMVVRREKATLSEDLDANRTAQFRLIDPPRTAKQPLFPSRLTLAPLVLLLALAAGVIASAMTDRLRPTFDSAKSLRLVTGRPVLGSVSVLVSPADQRRTRQITMAFGSSVAVLLLVGLVWVRWLTAASMHV
jgi:polysaccharide chain length determinant protein (PEP-CTERM system associated)